MFGAYQREFGRNGIGRGFSNFGGVPIRFKISWGAGLLDIEIVKLILASINLPLVERQAIDPPSQSKQLKRSLP
jgi:hypothetical protein